MFLLSHSFNNRLVKYVEDKIKFPLWGWHNQDARTNVFVIVMFSSLTPSFHITMGTVPPSYSLSADSCYHSWKNWYDSWSCISDIVITRCSWCLPGWRGTTILIRTAPAPGRLSSRDSPRTSGQTSRKYNKMVSRMTHLGWIALEINTLLCFS